MNHRRHTDITERYSMTHSDTGHQNLTVKSLRDFSLSSFNIAASDPGMRIMHEQLTDFPYKLVPEAMQNIRKIMQPASKEDIAMDSHLEDPFAQIRTYQSIMTEM